MEYKGIQIINEGENNLIHIEEGTPFSLSRIHIYGNNNKIRISKAKSISNLFLNLKGNNKTFYIGETQKNINNLKFTSIRGNNQSFVIGNSFSCGGMEIQMNDGDEKCTIGDDCLFSWGIKMRTSDGHSVIDIATDKAINIPRDILIGNHVWVGEDVKFLKGSSIPDNCIVGSYAVVTKAFLEQNIAIAGFPASVIKRGVNWDRRMPSEYNKDRL
ncbi:acyltransferase [Oceanimonas doudoroffii]|uniref:Acetyltransferase n=1 Tax=Oceanimonas doudoroffii TaxID=84158 RepID=A0A233RFE1_9GAMM|nr:hypothetical protein [Oceanimonas doudoroffii]OXY82112.1 hypothetical protein B6S08_00825 [Oceanimonas doudoroffii]